MWGAGLRRGYGADVGRRREESREGVCRNLRDRLPNDGARLPFLVGGAAWDRSFFGLCFVAAARGCCVRCVECDVTRNPHGSCRLWDKGSA